MSFGGSNDCLGQSPGDNLSHVGPFHHSEYSRSSEGKRPLDAESAGFSAPLTWFHLSGLMRSAI